MRTGLLCWGIGQSSEATEQFRFGMIGVGAIEQFGPSSLRDRNARRSHPLKLAMCRGEPQSRLARQRADATPHTIPP